MKLVLVERARSVWSRQDRIEGQVRLDPLPGELDRLRALGAELPEARPETVYAAPLEPDLASAKALAGGLGASVVTDAALMPLDMGAWTGLRRNEVTDRYGRLWRQWRARPDITGAPEGETMLEAARRLAPFWERVTEKDQPAAIVLSPEMAIILLTYVSGLHDNAGVWKAFRPVDGWMACDTARV